jgi:hypothetical protein
MPEGANCGSEGVSILQAVGPSGNNPAPGATRHRPWSATTYRDSSSSTAPRSASTTVGTEI